MAPETMKTYFKAASMFSLADRIATSTAAQTVVSSAKIQKSARLSEKSATVAVTKQEIESKVERSSGFLGQVPAPSIRLSVYPLA